MEKKSKIQDCRALYCIPLVNPLCSRPAKTFDSRCSPALASALLDRFAFPTRDGLHPPGHADVAGGDPGAAAVVATDQLFLPVGAGAWLVACFGGRAGP